MEATSNAPRGIEVSRLGAECDWESASADGQTVSFTVAEFAVLTDGRELILHRDRGFSLGWGSMETGNPPIGCAQTVDSLVDAVLTTVLPDEDDGEPHPWAWLAALLRVHGIDARAEDLRALPYEVRFTAAVREALDWPGSEPL